MNQLLIYLLLLLQLQEINTLVFRSRQMRWESLTQEKNNLVLLLLFISCLLSSLLLLLLLPLVSLALLILCESDITNSSHSDMIEYSF